MSEGTTGEQRGVMGILDDELAPIAQRASTCVDPDLLYVVEDRDAEPWKIVFLICIVLKMIYRLVGLVHQHHLLHISDEKLGAKYEKLPEDVKDLISRKHLDEARTYNRGSNC